MGHVVTSGGTEAAYQLAGFHGFTLADFLRPLERTVTLCGMTWLLPFAVHGTNRLPDAVLQAEAARYGRYLSDLADGLLPRSAVDGAHV
jgi:glutathione-regulated potassium-efflux system ancillary protein KefG